MFEAFRYDEIVHKLFPPLREDMDPDTDHEWFILKDMDDGDIDLGSAQFEAHGYGTDKCGRSLFGFREKLEKTVLRCRGYSRKHKMYIYTV